MSRSAQKQVFANSLKLTVSRNLTQDNTFKNVNSQKKLLQDFCDGFHSIQVRENPYTGIFYAVGVLKNFKKFTGKHKKYKYTRVDFQTFI